ncbi:calcium-translocating P-type ATPase [Saprolegnia parasitica CBS 223.65]|uniref:Calcium-transporting ATPase n=1 Tax=Saprolegnia parasitica (strain CBS 223.65) TaxID=695850 RepID=A0A067BZQ6_SAPPC|nr:calcium-translocating P-type ATPase [Saprolegnia parasitica CBS 223.65]KDO22335.1 calcium-translocating P-type ATPase [Saprolegnia parasitica CBS 223.65]|eukprot:XP_012206969.1 calcium-translocating P-type ATPase [Saprolegnia parasitica CBS 223.65]
MTHLLPGDLIRLIETPKEKVPSTLAHVGGSAGLAKSLDSSLEFGLDATNAKDLALRADTFGANFVPPPPPTTFLQLVWAAYKNLTLLVLTGAGVLSLILGFTVGGPDPTPRRLSSGDPATAWIEGFAILLAVTIVTLVTAVNNYQKEQQFRALSVIKDDERIKAIRNGLPCEVGKHDLLVGDVVRIDVGDILPADGIVFEASELKVDESAMTGESVLIAKHPTGLTPFVLSGTKVMQGMGKMLVLAVGVSSQAGMISALLVGGPSTPSSRTMTQISDDDAYVAIATPRDDESGASDKMLTVAPSPDEPEESPMQGKLDALTILLGKFGITMALLVFVVLIARFSIDQFAVDGRSWAGTADVKEFLHFFIVGVTVLVVAIPEGLPLAVTISLSFSVKKMLLDNNLVRHLSACETMGSATTICSDKTGTLTTNQMTVMQCCFGDTVFASPQAVRAAATDAMIELLVHSVAINSTAERVDGVFTGNKTECALLEFTASLAPTALYDDVRRSHANMHILPFSSAKKRMSVVVPLTKTSSRVYTKGASEIVLGLCSHMAFPDGSTRTLGPDEASFWRDAIIQRFANDGLRTLCLCYKDIAAPFEEVVAQYTEADLERDLTCVAIVGIEDPVRPDVPDAIRHCQRAGIVVRMVTGDNLATATSIAKKCGILGAEADALVMEGAEFRRQVLDGNGQLQQDVFDTIWPRLRVLARSSPQDKYTLVSGIMASTIHGPQVVAVTGDGTNDAPALKKAHVGFAMGICGTAVSKDASDIILMDDNFKSIVNAVKWGRNVYDSVSKFLQFQLTVTLTAITLCVLGAIFLEETPLSAVQLLWVNLIMNTFASLALATDTPSNAVLDRKPYPRTKPLISKKMTKHILGHLLVQLAILLTLTLEGDKLLQIPSGRKYETEDPSRPSVHYTVVFNTFVFLQLFNEINARVIHDEKRVVLRGLLTNRLYACISVLQVVLQVIFVQFGGNAFDCAPLSATQWAVCIGLGALSLPVGWSLRRIHSHHLPKWFALFRRAHPHSYLRFR